MKAPSFEVYGWEPPQQTTVGHKAGGLGWLEPLGAPWAAGGSGRVTDPLPREKHVRASALGPNNGSTLEPGGSRFLRLGSGLRTAAAGLAWPFPACRPGAPFDDPSFASCLLFSKHFHYIPLGFHEWSFKSHCQYNAELLFPSGRKKKDFLQKTKSRKKYSQSNTIFIQP